MTALAPPAQLPWLCRRGAHRWRRIWVGRSHTGLASITSRCERPGCPASRHDQHVTAPRQETP